MPSLARLPDLIDVRRHPPFLPPLVSLAAVLPQSGVDLQRNRNVR